jgi:hypothetical protein
MLNLFSSTRQIRSMFARSVAAASLGLTMLMAQTGHAGLIETFENAGVTSSSVKNIDVVNFNDLKDMYYSEQIFKFSSLTVTYKGDFHVQTADQYGGAQDPNDAGKDTNYIGVHSGEKVVMELSVPQAYFGIWYSAADKLNDLSFYRGDQLLASIKGTGPVLSSLSDNYKGNPTKEFDGQNKGENYVFINFSAQTKDDMFDKIVLSNAMGGTIFESDNHTFSADIQDPPPGNSVVPEPSSMFLLGIGVIGLMVNAIRRRRDESTTPECNQ